MFHAENQRFEGGITTRGIRARAVELNRPRQSPLYVLVCRAGQRRRGPAKGLRCQRPGLVAPAPPPPPRARRRHRHRHRHRRGRARTDELFNQMTPARALWRYYSYLGIVVNAVHISEQENHYKFPPNSLYYIERLYYFHQLVAMGGQRGRRCCRSI